MTYVGCLSVESSMAEEVTYAESSSKDIAEIVVVLLEADLTTSTILGTAFDRAGSSAGVAVATTARRAARASSTRLA
jgi:hypothetical protein